MSGNEILLWKAGSRFMLTYRSIQIEVEEWWWEFMKLDSRAVVAANV